MRVAVLDGGYCFVCIQHVGPYTDSMDSGCKYFLKCEIVV